MIVNAVKTIIRILLELTVIPLLVLAALLSRLVKKRFDIGLGPEPLINNVYHKKALQSQGYTAETFVSHVYFITHDFDKKLFVDKPVLPVISDQLQLPVIFALFRYRCLYLYFNGGMVGGTVLLWRFEPYLYQMAGVKVVVMPYGSDIQDLTRCPNLLFKHAAISDYPLHRLRRRLISRKIDLWTRHADHVIGGCDWVDYLYHWDTLMLAHFSIDVERIIATAARSSIASPLGKRPFRVLHAPNHRWIKGTKFVLAAVAELQEEGIDVELVLIEKMPNEKVLEAMAQVDLVVDQLIIGWYAMFALEAMAMSKPVICYLRSDLHQLYIDAGIVAKDEIPVISATPGILKDVIRELVNDPATLAAHGRRGPDFVRKHHSLHAIGQAFARINSKIGITPTVRS
jgi:glycosyltransferase involved in cell wall biosynthesis